MFKAEIALEDVKRVYQILESEDDLDMFRIYWFTCVSLLRAIGHILDKTDAMVDQNLRKEVDSWWKELNSPAGKIANPIFHEFINRERNTVIKEYLFNYSTSSTVLVDDGEIGQITLLDNLYQPLREGEYAGEDCRDMIGDSISWWEKQLGSFQNRI